jgi:creatinine amidohydrolase
VTKQTILLAECTLPQVEAHLRESPKVIVPLGATEQHGPHAPFCTDSLLATEAGVRIAPRVGALVAPAVPYGLSGDHHGFAGVPYVSVRTMIGLIQDIARSLGEGGFREIIFINGHYTNVIAISAALAEIGDRLPGDTIAFSFNYWDALPEGQLNDYLGEQVGLHANIGETSAVMAVDDSLVDLDSAVEEYPKLPGGASAAMVAAFFFSGRGTTYRATRSGVWGDPIGSSVQRGRAYLDQIEEAGVRFVEQVEATFRAFPPREPPAEEALRER